MEDGTLYSKRKGVEPFDAPSLEDYADIVGGEQIDKLHSLAQKLKGIKILELNSAAVGGGVAEMLYSQVPFLNRLGIEDEWKVVKGVQPFFQVTKTIHNLLQGMEGTLTPEMVEIYYSTLKENAEVYQEDCQAYSPDLVIVHDPQPLGLAHYLKRVGQKWLWRFHVDAEAEALERHPALWQFITFWASNYDAAIFSGARYVIDRWPLHKYISPPFIDPLSVKNRELTFDEIGRRLDKFGIDRSIPIIAQIGRYDRWKGLRTTIESYRLAKREENCQLLIAGGTASDDPEGERIFKEISEETKDDPNIHVIELPARSPLTVNALQRAAKIIMQPSIKEGFGLTITEGMWKGKPVIATEVGAIPVQIRDQETGFFIRTPQEGAERLVYLLRNPGEAEAMGRRGKQYVREHFLLPDRVADYLRIANYLVNGELDQDAIISYHPWFKLSKRKKGDAL